MVFKEETCMKSSSDDNGSEALTETKKVVEIAKSFEENSRSCPLSSAESEIIPYDDKEILQDHHLRSARNEMGKIREENEELKLVLSRIVKDYNSLQMQFHNIVEQEETKNTTHHEGSSLHQEEDPELFSLSLGRRFSGEGKTDNKKYKESNQEQLDGRLALGLGCRFETDPSDHVMKSPRPAENNLDDETKGKEQHSGAAWPQTNSLKTARSGNTDDDLLEENPLKKARVSVRAICDMPTMNDGCQWRKYGQKISKGNPCPRAYYRCTVSPACPVRKHVQRCSQDRSVLITTYEGTHNHPLPVSATAMASTTSAAIAMLRCGSSSSQPSLVVPSSSAAAAATTTAAANLRGLNFGFANSSTTTHHPLYFPRTSISTSQSHPTVTLDLTALPNNTSTASFARLPSSAFFSAPRYSNNTSSTTNCLNFSSSASSSPYIVSSSSSHCYSRSLFENKNHIGGSYLVNQITNEYLNKNSQISAQQNMTETVAAATKAITSDPSFRSALAAAITSFVGNASGGVGGNHSRQAAGELSGRNVLNRGDNFSLNLGYASTQNRFGCATSYLNRALPSSNSEQGNLTLFPTSFSQTASKLPSVTPADKSADPFKL